MKPNQKIICAIVALLALAGIVTTAILINNNSNNSTPDPVATCPIEDVEGALTVVYDGVVGETALVTLQGLCEVKTQSSSYGDFVTTIDGTDAGDTHYWAFYINDAYATEGAGTYKAKTGDKVKWVLTSLDAAY